MNTAMKQQVLPLFYSIKEVATRLGVSTQTIRREIVKRKTMKASRIGLQWMVSHEDLAEYLKVNSNIE